MVADTRAITSSPPDQQGPLPMEKEEMVRHLANSIAHHTEQLQTIHERLDRQSQSDEQTRPAHPPPVTQGGNRAPWAVPRSHPFSAGEPARTACAPKSTFTAAGPASHRLP